MKISERTHNDIVIIDPKGRLTEETAAFFTDALGVRFEGGRTRIILNLEQVTYIDSAGLGAIVQAFTSARRRNGRLVLIGVRGKNREILTVTRLLTVLDNFDTESDAVRSFGRPARIDWIEASRYLRRSG